MKDYAYLKINLQLFGEKTEPATPKRRQELRQKGQIPRSRELVTAVVLLISFFSMRFLSKFIFGDLIFAVRNSLSFPKDIDSRFTTNEIMLIFLQNLLIFAKILAPILLIVALCVIIMNYVQIGSVLTAKPLMPNLNKINPVEGFKRLFSKNAYVELLKSIFKIGIIGFIIYDYLVDNYRVIPELLNMNVESTMVFIGNTIISVGIRAAAVLLILSVFDYGFQKWNFEKEIRMSKQEIKDEYKLIEGNPQIKSKIKEKQRQLSLRRMMAEVPSADVIITNPTHFAIAVKYEEAVSEAPVVIAKGKDLIAEKIKDTAKKNNVPIVENKPLAQALYKSVEIGQQIPSELYKAVAEVLAYVYSLKDK
ncbi:MAG TPA: flagellar biosynthesis protein FlhB [Bacillota bacterium]|nr:flagellar biosynthesis protein FlhB [Clostridiaceae bacterium]HNR03973.1 flagellar biosynthesis protein FlhB [Bacillota bacterium]HNT02286.1 flagellar biosynthesis protein FlhB [Bacillota bacterium]HPX68763.1 flagellar biosynthesis protein FlhB [Bacillota bacterium]HQA65109.1 flagellar biosynthesis protein FlhB [Bacillota bacterium]